jgi:hypothetical protein
MLAYTQGNGNSTLWGRLAPTDRKVTSTSSAAGVRTGLEGVWDGLRGGVGRGGSDLVWLVNVLPAR